MKHLLFAFLALALSACATSTPSVRLSAAQGLLVAEAGVDGVNHIATVAAQSHTFTPTQAGRVKSAVDAANISVSTAHSLYLTGDIPAAVAALQTALANIAAARTETLK